MNKFVLGAFVALVLAGIGLFWLEGRAEVERGAPPPDPAAIAEAAGPDPMDLPEADPGDMRGPAPPEATELTREQQRFGRYDRDRDGKITRREMMSSRTASFRKLDKDGNNLLTFEEWATSTSDRFAGMDANRDGELSAPEFATSAPKPKKKTACSC